MGPGGGIVRRLLEKAADDNRDRDQQQQEPRERKNQPSKHLRWSRGPILVRARFARPPLGSSAIGIAGTDFRFPVTSARADLETDARVRRDSLSRLAVSEEHRPYRAGGVAAGRAGASRRRRIDRRRRPHRRGRPCSRASRAPESAQDDPGEADRVWPQRPSSLRRQRARGFSCVAATSTRATTPGTGLISIASLADAPPSTSDSSGGSRIASTLRR